MELRHLRYFVMVGETLNLSKASKRLHVSQPALSRQIRDLEDELGSMLFVRHPNGVELTPAGVLFMERSLEILRKASSAVREIVDSRRDHQLALRLGFDHGAVYDGLFRALQEFGSVNAGTQLCLRESERGDLLRLLQEEEMDIALIAGSPDPLPADVDYQVVSRQRLQVCIGLEHPLASASKLRLEQLSTEQLILLKSPLFPSWQQTIVNACRRAGFEPAKMMSVSSHAALLGLVAANRGYALFPKEAWSYESCESVKAVDLAEPLFWTIGAAWRRSSTLSLREAFLSELRSQTVGSVGGPVLAFG